MRFGVPFTAADFGRATRAQVTPRLFAHATFEGVRAAYAFREFYLKPLLQGVIHPTPRERAVMGLHYRMVGYLASVRKLDAPIHFQSIASAARSIFEIGLDLALLTQDATMDSVDRLAAFTRVERYHAAERLVRFFATHQVPADLDLSTQRALCADEVETAQVTALRVQHWGQERNGNPIWPSHWSRVSDTRQRAARVGWEERYVRYFSTMSWHVHAGLTGVADLPAEAFDLFAAEAHRLVKEVMLDSYGVLGRELHLAHSMPEWDVRLAFLRRVTGLALVDRQLESLGEPQRFAYLEAHERDVV
jgi:hypothetical protein